MRIRIAAVVAVAGLALGGCGGAAAPRTAASSASPASSTAAATGSTASHTAAQIARHLKAGGMDVTQLIVYTPATDPNHLMGRQGGYTSKVAWVDPSAVASGAGNPRDDPGGIEYGGGIEVFPDHASAQARYDELKSLTAPFGDGYDYLHGNAVLRLSQYLVPSIAQEYAAKFGS
jgi:hypothetical protein